MHTLSDCHSKGGHSSEVLPLEVKDIDFTQGTATIEHLKSRIQLTCLRCGVRVGKSHSFCHKCGAQVSNAVAQEKEHRRQRTLPLDSDTLNMLKSYIDQGGIVPRNGKQFLFGITRGHA